MLRKKQKAEVIYRYPADGDFFILIKILNEPIYLALMQKSINFSKISEVEKVLSHLCQNFYYFICNNFNYEELKQESLELDKEEKIIGAGLTYYLTKYKNEFVLELPEELECGNLYEIHKWFTLLLKNIKNDIEAYKNSKKIIINLIGASGSGKTTIGNYLKEKNIPELVSHTTRTQRDGEKEGETYYFTNINDFLQMEKVQQTVYSDNFYCLSKKEIFSKLENNDLAFVITAIDGAKQIEKNFKDIKIVKIFVKTDEKTMRIRMEERGDTHENIEKRIKYAMSNKEFLNEQYADFILDNTKSIQNTKDQMDSILTKLKNQQQFI